MTELSLLEKLRLAHVTTGQRMLGEAAERIEELKELLRIANNDFFDIEATTFDMKSRIAELEAALKPFADASDVHLGSDDMSIAFRIIIGNLRQARKVLENA